MDAVRWVVTLAGVALIAAVNVCFFLRPRPRAVRGDAAQGDSPRSARGS
jgi:hypothetical protein